MENSETFDKIKELESLTPSAEVNKDLLNEYKKVEIIKHIEELFNKKLEESRVILYKKIYLENEKIVTAS